MDGVQNFIFYAAGGDAIVYSLLTNYELGLIKLIPMKIHLVFDILSGVILAVSPLLFQFSDAVYLPHLILGLIKISAALLTSSKLTRQIND